MAQQSHFSLQLLTPPAIEPVSLDYVKRWLKIDDTSLDDHLLDMIKDARSRVEDYAGRSFVNTTYVQYLDRFPLLPNSQYSPGNPNTLAPVTQNVYPLDPSVWAIKLARSPVQGVASVKYYDNSLTLTTMDPATYTLDNISEPSRLSTTTNSFWPGAAWMPNAVQIQFTAGYGASAAAVPAKWKRAILATVGAWFDNPNGPAADLPDAVKALIDADPVAEVW